MGETQTHRVRCSPPLQADGDISIEEIGPAQLLIRYSDPNALTRSVLAIPSHDCRLEIQSIETIAQSPHTALVTPTSSEAVRDLLARLRKNQHIELCRDVDVEASDRSTGFEALHFVPRTIPEVESVSTRRHFLGRGFGLPILITGMTGGVDQGARINRNLAQAAQKWKIPMGVGSQRMAIDDPKLKNIFAVKDQCPDVFLIGNLGIAQLTGSDGLQRCIEAVEMIQADALAIHVNIVQELVQVEGDRHFAGFLEQLRQVCQQLNVPVIVKEVGCGMDQESARALQAAGVAAIDIGGRGGTSWSRIEGLRGSSALTKRLGERFRDWGIPTAHSLAATRRALGADFPVIATGGMRDGHTVAKAVALGASMVGIGLPLFRAALQSAAAVEDELFALDQELRITMFATGSAQLQDLQRAITFGKPYSDELRLHMEELKRGN